MAKSNAIHIGIYGRRNAGKSTLINAITGQEVSIVSPIAGTTTDPVKRSFELLGAGPAIFIDTAGIDDGDELGAKRIEKTLATLKQVDIAILLFSAPQAEASREELQLLAKVKELSIPFIAAYNNHGYSPAPKSLERAVSSPIIELNARSGEGLEQLLEQLQQLAKQNDFKRSLLGDIVKRGDVVLLVTPTDSEAPAGRLILPQVNTIRDILDSNAVAVVAKEAEVEDVLKRLTPSLVITDSQLFKQVGAIVPESVPLTSFSIIFARQKGNFDAYLKGTLAISQLKDGDRVLLLESCSHQTSCDDIGRVKIPSWLSKFTGKQLAFDMVVRHDDMPYPLSSYAMVVQCGGCMATHKQLASRLQPFISAGIPVTNYGMVIAYTQGIFNRAVKLFTGQQAIN